MLKGRALAISGNGFVFDPETGNSFTANESGRILLTGLLKGEDQDDLALHLRELFGLSSGEAERDVSDFCNKLRTMGYE